VLRGAVRGDVEVREGGCGVRVLCVAGGVRERGEVDGEFGFVAEKMHELEGRVICGEGGVDVAWEWVSMGCLDEAGAGVVGFGDAGEGGGEGLGLAGTAGLV
jgi:hypothetical protein